MKVIKFSASWCAPCAEYAPIFKKSQDEFPDLTFESVDVENKPDFAAKYRIMSIPATIILNDDGNEVERHIGVINDLSEKLTLLIGS